MTYVGGDLYPTYFAVILCGPCLVHVDSVNGIGLTLGPPSIFIALQQHTPLYMHVHSGNGKLTLLSYTSNKMQHKHLCIAVHAWGLGRK